MEGRKMWFFKEDSIIDDETQFGMMKSLVDEARERFGSRLKKVLLLPPDITRFHSGAGELTNMLYHILEKTCEVDVIPTLGQHVPHTSAENHRMFGDIPQARIHRHDWERSCLTLGEINRDIVRRATGGAADWPIPVQINRAVVEGGYDLVINIGQVVPHEVLGFSNHNKNYFIGLGGRDMIGTSHITAALCGIENNLGQIMTPLRGCFNLAEKKFLRDVRSVYVLTVKSKDETDRLSMTGLYVGEDTSTYVRAARFAGRKTIHVFDRPLKKVVCFMDGDEFRSTWVANKAVYRTRMVMEEGGELIIIAPGVERFGEQEGVDRMIRRYGYKGTSRSLEAYRNDGVLRGLAHTAAHLIHGSTEGRFTITYAPGKLSAAEIESVGYNYLDMDEATEKYNPAVMVPGINRIGAEEIYFIESPSLGLWSTRERFAGALEKNTTFCERMMEEQPADEIWQEMWAWNREDRELLENLHR